MAKSVLTGLPATIYKATKGLFRQGILRRETPGAVDEYGDPTDATVATFPYDGWREDYSAAYRERASIPQTDCRIGVFAASVTVEPIPGDDLQIEDRKSTRLNSSH